jgi:hypothetical protein
MTVALPPHSADFPICPKCKGDSASTEYKDSLSCMFSDHSHETKADEGRSGTPRLCRRCDRCGYAWDEACEDAPAAEVDPDLDAPELALPKKPGNPLDMDALRELAARESGGPVTSVGSGGKGMIQSITIMPPPHDIPRLIEEQRHARLRRQRSLPGTLTSMP